MKNIYVGNLDSTTTEGQLRELFCSFGTLASVTMVVDRDTGNPRGFAFVEMSDDSDADTAIKALNGSILNDRPLLVNEARPKQDEDRQLQPERRKNPRAPLTKRKHRQHRY